jgi:hypothetical protein
MEEIKEKEEHQVADYTYKVVTLGDAGVNKKYNKGRQNINNFNICIRKI